MLVPFLDYKASVLSFAEKEREKKICFRTPCLYERAGTIIDHCLTLAVERGGAERKTLYFAGVRDEGLLQHNMSLLLSQCVFCAVCRA